MATVDLLVWAGWAISAFMAVSVWKNRDEPLVKPTAISAAVVAFGGWAFMGSFAVGGQGTGEVAALTIYLGAASWGVLAVVFALLAGMDSEWRRQKALEANSFSNIAGAGGAGAGFNAGATPPPNADDWTFPDDEDFADEDEAAHDDADFDFDPSRFDEDEADGGAGEDETEAKLWAMAEDDRTPEAQRQNAMRQIRKRSKARQITKR